MKSCNKKGYKLREGKCIEDSSTKTDTKKLVYSVLIDGIGVGSYFILGMGEITDIVWAPISAFLVYNLYGSVSGSVINVVEEGLPFTDFVPTATLLWLNEKFKFIRI